MLKMRLQRIGRKNAPTYRILVVDSRQGPKSGKFIDHIGSYEPKSGTIQLDGEKAKTWIAKGVQTSGTVHNMLVTKGVINAKKRNVLPKKTPIIKEEAPVTEAALDASASETPGEATTAEEAKEEVVA